MRRSIDSAVAAARARRQPPAAISAEVAKQQLRDAEVLRACVTRLGPTTYAHRLDIPCRCGRAHDATPRPRAMLAASNGHAPAPGRRVVATYAYQDEAGALLFEVIRYEPKKFSQRRPDGHGGWIYDTEGVRRVLYRLPELTGQEGVYVVEGEKDADALWERGLPATTNSGGADQWKAENTEYAAQLRAAGIETAVIVPDNDQAGVRHAAAVERSCQAAGLTAFVVPLPGLPPVKAKHGEDVSDWLNAGHSVTALEALVEAAAAPQATDAAPGPGPVLVRLSDVAAEPVAWLWPGRLARGKVTLLAGDPGLGKSFVTLDVAARISTARPWPDGGAAMLGNTILLSAEDGLADTIRPRVDALEGDPSRLHVLRAVRNQTGEHPFSLAADLSALESAITATGALLVIIDPLSAYLGATDSYKDAEVGALLAPLAAVAERHQVAVLTVMHLTKDSQRRAIHRASGSVGFVGAARVVLAVGKDQEDEARRLLVPVKTNVSAPPATLGYRVMGCPPDGSARVEWEPEPVTDVDADALLGVAAIEDREERRDAGDLLRDLLSAGEQLSTELFKAAKANGVCERTLYRAKRRLGIKARKVGQPGKKGAWYWSLPEEEWTESKAATTAPKAAISSEVAAFEQLSDEKDETAQASPKAATSQGMAAFGGSLRVDGTLPGSPPAPGEERL